MVIAEGSGKCFGINVKSGWSGVFGVSLHDLIENKTFCWTNGLMDVSRSEEQLKSVGRYMLTA